MYLTGIQICNTIILGGNELMNINLDALVSYEKVKSDIEEVLNIVEKQGNAIIVRDDKPAYIISKFSKSAELALPVENKDTDNYKLQEAMQIVLREAKDNTMHAANLADEIFKKKLYLKKDGSKAQYNQIRARCDHYPDLFEALPGNIIRLKSR